MKFLIVLMLLMSINVVAQENDQNITEGSVLYVESTDNESQYAGQAQFLGHGCPLEDPTSLSYQEAVERGEIKDTRSLFELLGF